MALKTLKDLDNPIDNYVLRERAREWVEASDYDFSAYMTDKELENTNHEDIKMIKNWVTHFFNLEGS
jgi:hypothetical protein